MNTAFRASVNLNFYWRNAVCSYHFNGKETDDEITGNSGDSYDFGARMYDTRLGRWLSRDPYARAYADLSCYAFVANSPCANIDIEGKYIKPLTAKSNTDLADSWTTLFKLDDGTSPMANVFNSALVATRKEDGSVGYSYDLRAMTPKQVKAFHKAYSKAYKKLSPEQQAVAQGYYKEIVSTQEYAFYSYQKGDNLSSLFYDDDLQRKYGNEIDLAAKIASNGGGFNITDESSSGISRQLVVVDLSLVATTTVTTGTEEPAKTNAQGSTTGGGTGTVTNAEVIAHEMVGHALAETSGYRGGKNNEAAIQVSNLVRKIENTTGSRNGADHGGKVGNSNGTPEYLKK